MDCYLPYPTGNPPLGACRSGVRLVCHDMEKSSKLQGLDDSYPSLLGSWLRHLHSSDSWTSFSLTRVQYHQELIDAILKSNNDEGITDLVYASYMVDHSCQLALDICANYIVDFCSGATGPFSSRLRKIFSACVELRGFNALEEVGKGRFVELLRRLHVGIEDVIVTNWHFSRSFRLIFLILTILIRSDLILSTPPHSFHTILPAHFVHR